MTWTLRAVWLTLPFTIGDSLSDRLQHSTTPTQAIWWVLAGTAWSVGTVALASPIPVAATALRLAAPAAVVTAGWSVTGQRASVLGVVGLVSAVVAAALAISGWVLDDCVNGASYGDERRFGLRAPAAVAVIWGPVTTAVGVVGIGSGPLLLADRQWVAGAIAVAVGGPAAWLAIRSLHQLATRFVVFVPAGMTLVDPLTLVDANLFPKRAIIALRPAPLEGDRIDLSQGALGLALEVSVDEVAELTVKAGPKQADVRSAMAVVFTPARPAAVLQEAVRRGIATGSAATSPPPTTTSPR